MGVGTTVIVFNWKVLLLTKQTSFQIMEHLNNGLISQYTQQYEGRSFTCPSIGKILNVSLIYSTK